MNGIEESKRKLPDVADRMFPVTFISRIHLAKDLWRNIQSPTVWKVIE